MTGATHGGLNDYPIEVAIPSAGELVGQICSICGKICNGTCVCVTGIDRGDPAEQGIEQVPKVVGDPDRWRMAAEQGTEQVPKVVGDPDRWRMALVTQKEPPDKESRPSGCWKYQQTVHSFYLSKPVEISVAVLIVFNFLVQCFQAHVDPFKDRHEVLWFVFETFFNIIFLVELSLNMYGSWFYPFWGRGWNRFDFVVVSIGVMDLCQIPLPGPLSAIRLLRAFRVFRLFGRVDSLKKTVDSIFHALPGVMSAFAIVLLVLAIYSVLAVDFFKELFDSCHDKPEDFVMNTPRGLCFGDDYYGNFAKAMYTLFQILTGESWSEAAVRPVYAAMDTAIEHAAVSFFFFSFVLINGVVIINVVVAFLMDGMSGGGGDKDETPSPPYMVPIHVEDDEDIDELHSDIAALQTKLDLVIVETRQQLMELLEHWPDLKQTYEEERVQIELAELAKKSAPPPKPHRSASSRVFEEMPPHTGPCAPFWKYQPQVRAFYHSQPIEIGVACLIAGAFFIQCTNAQIDPKGEEYEEVWELLDTLFNVVFLIELLLNMYGSWAKAFWVSGWNRFDFTVVSIGVLSLCRVPLPGPMGRMAKLLRAFRVFRLFGRVESLNKVINMIQRALPGVMSAFLVTIITLCIYAVLSVDLFKDVYSNCGESDEIASITKRGQCFGKDYYGNFLKSLYTLFQILTGESWSEAAVRPVLQYYADSELELAISAFFFISFILVHSVVMLNVVVAFLIDGMGDPFADGEDEQDTEDSGPFSAKGELASLTCQLEAFTLEIRENLDAIFNASRPIALSSI